MMNTVENKDMSWIGRYIGVIVVSLILAAAIGSMGLFEKTFVIPGKLSASHLVRFLGYGAALAALWMLGQRATIALQQHRDRWSFLQHLILPVVTLIVVASANSIALLILKPMMNPAMHNIYNWVFIAGILACSAWVVMAVMGQSASLTTLCTSIVGRLDSDGKLKECAACNTSNEAAAKFCKRCGKELLEIAA